MGITWKGIDKFMERKWIDGRGLACPLPVVNAKKALAEFQGEGVLTVLVDNEIAVQNLQKFGKQKGIGVSGQKKSDREYEVTLQISGNQETLQGNAAQASQKEGCIPDSKRKGMVVALSANVMGNGEAKLGKALMKAFDFALTKQELLPETVICYNSGAHLTCQGSECLEDFKTLEAEGVQIVTCGTCLDFYGLKEKLSVGSVTNMYEIVELMEKAEVVIRP